MPVSATGASEICLTGRHILDKPEVAGIRGNGDCYDLRRAILIHELGPVAGLGRVDDPAERVSPNPTHGYRVGLGRPCRAGYFGQRSVRPRGLGDPPG